MLSVGTGQAAAAIVATKDKKLTWMPASSGDQAMKVILFLTPGISIRRRRRRGQSKPARHTAHPRPRQDCTQSRRQHSEVPYPPCPISALDDRRIVPLVKRAARQRTASYHLVLGGGVDQLLAEGLPVFIGRSILDNDLTVIVGQLEDDVLVLLVQLEVVVGGDALLANGSSEVELSLVDCRLVNQSC